MASFDLEVTKTGQLRIRADEEAIEEIFYLRRDRELDDDLILWELTEGYWTNGSFTPFNAEDGNPFVGLTGAPCVAEDMSVHDDGTKEIVGRFWYWPAYMTKSFIDEILEHGSVVFTLA